MQDGNGLPVAEPARPRWLAGALFVLPWALGLVLLLCAVGWGLWQSTSSDVRAAAGALAIWLVGNAAVVAYLGCRHSLWSDPDAFWPKARPTLAKRNKLITAAIYVGAGLWIGLVARHPLAAAVATRLVTYLIWRLNALRLPPAEREPILSKVYLKRSSLELAVICAGAAIGSLLRSLR